MSSYGLTSLITKPTRVTSNTAALIDHFFTNDDIHEIETYIITSDISDHFILFAAVRNLKLPKLEPSKKNQKIFNCQLG